MWKLVVGRLPACLSQGRAKRHLEIDGDETRVPRGLDPFFWFEIVETTFTTPLASQASETQSLDPCFTLRDWRTLTFAMPLAGFPALESEPHPSS